MKFVERVRAAAEYKVGQVSTVSQGNFASIIKFFKSDSHYGKEKVGAAVSGAET